MTSAWSITPSPSLLAFSCAGPPKPHTLDHHHHYHVHTLASSSPMYLDLLISIKNVVAFLWFGLHIITLTRCYHLMLSFKQWWLEMTSQQTWFIATIRKGKNEGNKDGGHGAEIEKKGKRGLGSIRVSQSWCDYLVLILTAIMASSPMADNTVNIKLSSLSVQSHRKPEKLNSWGERPSDEMFTFFYLTIKRSRRKKINKMSNERKNWKEKKWLRQIWQWAYPASMRFLISSPSSPSGILRSSRWPPASSIKLTKPSASMAFSW